MGGGLEGYTKPVRRQRYSAPFPLLVGHVCSSVTSGLTPQHAGGFCGCVCGKRQRRGHGGEF